MASTDDGGGRCAGRFLAAFALGLASCATPEPAEPVWVRPETEIATYDPSGRPTTGTDIATEVHGLGPERSFEPVPWSELEIMDANQDPEAQDPPVPDQDPEEEQRRQQALIRIAFGDDVLIGADGRVTKQYFLSQDAGAMFLNLMAPISVPRRPTEKPTPPAPPKPQAHFGGDKVDSVLGRLLGPDHDVEIVYLPDFETGANIVPRKNAQDGQSQIRPGAISNSLLLVTAQPTSLAAFEKALNLFYANIPQIEIEVKVVEYSTVDTLTFGIVPIDENTPTFDNLSSGKLIRDITTNFPASSIGGATASGQGLITLGGIHDSWELNATLQMLETNNIADIVSTPKLVVRSGGLATVRTTTSQPFPQAKIVNQTTVATNIAFKEVGIIMDIRPEIAGTDTVILNVYASVSAIVGFVESEPVATPIIATREASTSVHLRVGETTVIGGLITDSTIEVESKIPILGDIPILGYLFRSTSTQKSKTALEFHITPRILRGSRGR